jgi:MFS family permease
VLVAFVIGFAIFAPLFYVALFFQDVAGYSPIQSGFGFLPATALIIVAAPRAGRLADRVGPRVPIVLGLGSVTAALLWLSRLHVGSTYLALLPGFALLGIGVGMTMSPMTTAAMNAIGAQRAGVGAGIVNMSRLFGGTMGIALTGIIVTALGRARLGALLPSLSAPLRAQLLSHVSGSSVRVPASIASAGQHAFSYGVARGLLLGAGVSVVGAIGAWALIAPRRRD